jgi:DNA-binding transcriptional LysR family regulator
MNSSNSSEPISSHASVVRRIAQALPAPSAAIVHTGTGGWFSRALLLANALDTALAAKKSLCFFVTDEDMRRFAKFFSAHTGRGVASVDSAESLAAAISADRGIFALPYSALRAKLPSDYDLRALVLRLSRGDRVRPVDAIERLLALGYRHDPDVTIGTYRLD